MSSNPLQQASRFNKKLYSLVFVLIHLVGTWAGVSPVRNFPTESSGYNNPGPFLRIDALFFSFCMLNDSLAHASQ